jgi:hypothetical protein
LQLGGAGVVDRRGGAVMNVTRMTLALIAGGPLLVALLYFGPSARADEPDVGSLVRK